MMDDWSWVCSSQHPLHNGYVQVNYSSYFHFEKDVCVDCFIWYDWSQAFWVMISSQRPLHNGCVQVTTIKWASYWLVLSFLNLTHHTSSSHIVLAMSNMWFKNIREGLRISWQYMPSHFTKKYLVIYIYIWNAIQSNI